MNIIVAVNSDWGIGKNGTQTIVIPEDRRRFRKITDGGVVISGRRTFQDFGKPLANRKNIVLSNNKNLKIDGITIAHSVDEVIKEISGEDPTKVFVAGGGRIYKLFLPMCDYAYITKIGAAPISDTFFPNLDEMPEWAADCADRSNERITQSPEQNDATLSSCPANIPYSFILYRNTRILPAPDYAL